MTKKKTPILIAVVLTMATSGVWAQALNWAVYHRVTTGEMNNGQTIQTADGGFLLSATTVYDDPGSGGSSFSHYLAKYGPKGILQGQREIDERTAVDVEEIRFFGFTMGYFVLSQAIIERCVNNSCRSANGVALARMDAQGNLLWDKLYGYLSFNMAGSEMIVDGSGITIAGELNPRAPEQDTDAWVMRVDLEGNLIWHNRYDHKFGEAAVSIAKVGDRGYVLAGNWHDEESDRNNIWVLEINKKGQVLNHRQFDSGHWDWLRDIVVADDTLDAPQYILVGGSDVNDWQTNTDVLAMRFDMDPDHEPMWTKVYNVEAGPSEFDFARSAILHEITPGVTELVIVGSTDIDNRGPTDGMVLRLDPTDGAVKWQRFWGGAKNDVLYDVQPAASGNYMVTGLTGSFDTNHESRIWAMALGPQGLPATADFCWMTDQEMTTRSVALDSDHAAAEMIPMALIVDSKNPNISIPDSERGPLCVR